MRSRPLLVLCAMALPAASLPGQELEVRARLDSMRRSLLPIADSTQLLVLERRRMSHARANRDDPLIHMEMGFIAFRLGEVTGSGRHYGDAAGEFEWAAELRPGWAYAWHWMGLAELAVGESRVIALENIRQMLGLDALSKAARAFARAVEADPSFSAALVDLATTALRQRISPRTAVAQRALRDASATSAGRVPEVLLMRGRIERELGEHDSALAAFRAYAAAGGDAAVGGIEAARSLAALGRRDSALAAYRAAVRLPATAAARGEIRTDLRWIAASSELAGFDAAPAESVGAVVERFWASRDAASGRRSGDRLLEHFRRLDHARGRYRLVSRHRQYDITDVYRDTAQRELDDRGAIYVRHGEPDRRAVYAGGGQVEPNESWLYARTPPERELVFHFVARGDVQDYKLVESVLDVLGFSAAIAVQTRLDAPPGAAQPLTGAGAAALAQALLTSRAELSPLYEQLARGGSVGRSRLLAEEREAGRRTVREGTTTDSHPLRYASDLRPLVSSFSVRGESGRPELHLVFAVPGSRLHPLQAAGGGSAYALLLRLVVLDAARNAVARLDTIRVFRSPRPLTQGAFLTERVAIDVPPGRYSYRFVIEEVQSDAGAVTGQDSVAVHPVGPEFSASDLVVGREGSGLVWRRAEGEVRLNPLMRFAEGSEASLFYEIYGLPQGVEVETSVRVRSRGGRSVFRRVFGGGRDVSLTYTTVTDAPGRSAVRQQLSLAGLGPGRYQLELMLARAGDSIVRTAAFEIHEAP
jgi:GWxTD domain-containing protein